MEKENSAASQSILDLIEKNGIDSKSFSAGHFPNHLQSIINEKFNPKNKTYHEFDDIKINKTAKDRNEIEAIIPEMIVFNIALEDGTITQMACSESIVENFELIEETEGKRLNVYLKEEEPHTNPIPGIYVALQEFPKELSE